MTELLKNLLKTSLLILMASLSVGVYHANAEQKPLSFVWFSSLYPEHSFWRQNWEFTKAAADQLNITLTPYYLNSDQVKYKTLLAELGKDERFDGVIFVNLKKQDRAIVELIQAGKQAGVNHTIPMNYAITGKPGANNSKWVAEVLVDEEKSGYDLAKRLITQAQKQGLADEQGNILVFSINGSKTDSVGVRREQGFLKAIAEYDNVVLQQKFNARHWSKQESYKFARLALKRYPKTHVVISGNDDIALGVIEAAKEHGLNPGKDILTGGIDGTTELLEKVNAGDAVCTISGLFLHGAWSLIVLNDHLKGAAIAERGSHTINVGNTLVDSSNVALYLSAFRERNWQDIDFLSFSKSENSKLERYAFSLDSIVKQLSESK